MAVAPPDRLTLADIAQWINPIVVADGAFYRSAMNPASTPT